MQCASGIQGARRHANRSWQRCRRFAFEGRLRRALVRLGLSRTPQRPLVHRVFCGRDPIGGSALVSAQQRGVLLPKTSVVCPWLAWATKKLAARPDGRSLHQRRRLGRCSERLAFKFLGREAIELPWRGVGSCQRAYRGARTMMSIMEVATSTALAPIKKRTSAHRWGARARTMRACLGGQAFDRSYRCISDVVLVVVVALPCSFLDSLVWAVVCARSGRVSCSRPARCMPVSGYLALLLVWAGWTSQRGNPFLTIVLSFCFGGDNPRPYPPALHLVLCRTRFRRRGITRQRRVLRHRARVARGLVFPCIVTLCAPSLRTSGRLLSSPGGRSPSDCVSSAINQSLRSETFAQSQNVIGHLARVCGLL